MQRLILLAPVTLAACVTAGAALSPQAERGLAFANANCTACHAITANAAQSPYPRAPTFEMIANREGLSRDTLGTFLRDAHNYPESMDFTLDPNEVDDLVEYMLTLRRANYRPPI